MNATVLLSHSLSRSTPLYGGANNISIIADNCIESGNSCNSLKLAFPNHASTHIDMPAHFIAGGDTISDVPASYWTFHKVAIWSRPASAGELITLDESIPNQLSADLLFIRTGWEKRRDENEYWSSGPGLSPELAGALQLHFPKLRAVGVDFISITSYKHREKGREAHREFLGRNFMLIEDMKLSNLDSLSGPPEQVIVAPLLVEKADGAPATILAFRRNK